MKRFKRLLSVIFVFIIMISSVHAAALADNGSVIAKPTSSAVLINGKNVDFKAYNIGGNNYFKLRELAAALSGTVKQFNVMYDSTTKTILVMTGDAYIPGKNDNSRSESTENVSASLSSAVVSIVGSIVNLTAYNIDGYNYFKLRDVAFAMNFGVSYDNEKNTICVDTAAEYTKQSADSISIQGTWAVFSRNGVVYNDTTTRTITFGSDGSMTAVDGSETMSNILYTVEGNEILLIIESGRQIMTFTISNVGGNTVLTLNSSKVTLVLYKK